MKNLQKQRAFRVRAVGLVHALLIVFLVTQCGPPKRDFDKAGGGTSGGGAAGRIGTAGSGNVGTAGRSGGASGLAGRVGDDAGDSGDGGIAGLASLGGNGGTDLGGNGSGGASSGSGGTGGGAVGTACSTSTDCALGNCIDGVCCEGPCTGCKACSAKLTGKVDGSCAPVVGGQDPHNQCDDVTATNQCGTDGACDGAGACRKVSSSHVCGAASCTGSTFKPVATCDGAGACTTPTTENCGAYPCATTGCAKTCSLQTDCSATSYCKITSGTTGTCTAKNPNGTAASSTFECTSNIVADGVCCDTACTGCKACSGAPLTGGAAGQCLNVLAGKVAHSACTASGQTCGLDGSCDGNGACRSTPLQGAACTSSNKCLTGTTCNAGACSGGTAVPCGAPATCKAAGVCDPTTGNCSYANAANNSSCNDGSACTSPDTCQSGVCTGVMACAAAGQCKAASVCSGTTCGTPLPLTNGVKDPTCAASTPVCFGGACVQCTVDSPDCAVPTPSCGPNHTCVCRKQSASNKLINPGFDGSFASWVNTNGTTTSATLSPDSESCSGSNSGYVASTEYDPKQCVPGTVTPGATYFLGGKFKGPPTGSFVRLHFFSGANCTSGQVSGSAETVLWLPGDADWTLHTANFTAPPGSVSVDVAIYGIDLYFDQLYFGTAGQF